MNLPFHIARRYLFSKKSHNAINIISLVSVLGVAAATLAMVCALSVFNGFQQLLFSMYDDFDPDLKIKASEGKTFVLRPDLLESIRQNEKIAQCCECLEENALARYKNSQAGVVVKGVSDNFKELAAFDSTIRAGRFVLEEYDIPYATIGIGLANYLGTGNSFIDPISLYAPKRNENVNMLNPAASFKTKRILLCGTFSIYQPEYDECYVIVPLSLARELFGYTDELTSLELRVKEGVSVKQVKRALEKLLGTSFSVQTLAEQKADLYRINRIEKWITYLILCFILLIALFNVIGSLSMLMLEKKKDTIVLSYLGVNQENIRKVFFYEGLMIAFIGALGGILLGTLLCLLQQHFGLLKLGNGDFVVDAYPVLIQGGDLLFTLITVLIVSLPSIKWPVHAYFGKNE